MTVNRYKQEGYGYRFSHKSNFEKVPHASTHGGGPAPIFILKLVFTF